MKTMYDVFSSAKEIFTMLISKLLGERLKENPSEASLVSHRFLLRGGYVRQVTNGIYTLLPPAMRIAANIERIIREEMDGIGGQEVLFPVVLPAGLWMESGRYDRVGSELMRMKDRSGRDMLLGMTHEEAAVQLARTEATSHSQYPFMIYQIQTKFRDEPRSRGGLIRVREFTMKDAYSFHTTQEDLERYYSEVFDAYHRIFARVGLPQVVSVGSDTGMMGGKIAHEYMLLSDAGEDSIMLCPSCGYKANMDVAVAAIVHGEDPERELEEIHTPGVRDIATLATFCGVGEEKLMKAAVFAVQGQTRPLIVFIRGDLQVNESKLRRIAGADVTPWASGNDSGLKLGFVGAFGLDAASVEVLYDESLKGEKNLIGGTNRKDWHVKGFSMPRELPGAAFADIAKVNDRSCCRQCGGELRLQRGIEVGNIFQLGSRYTESMNMTYADMDGKRKNPVMGCYGIGIGRLIACLIEASHDEYGPIWPLSTAPWQIHICLLNKDHEAVGKTGYDLYERLKARYEVILDDREAAAGIQFADADLLGIPVRIVVSRRNLEKGELEISTRDKKIRMQVPIADVEDRIAALIGNGHIGFHA